MSPQSVSIFSRKLNPIKFGLLILGLTFVTMGIVYFSALDKKVLWQLAFMFLLIFSLVTSLMIITAEDQNKYWSRSLIAFVMVAVFGGLFARQFSGISMADIPSLKYMYMTFTFVYLILLTIIRTMRKIIEIAQRHDDRMGQFHQRKRKPPSSESK